MFKDNGKIDIVNIIVSYENENTEVNIYFNL